MNDIYIYTYTHYINTSYRYIQYLNSWKLFCRSSFHSGLVDCINLWYSWYTPPPKSFVSGNRWGSISPRVHTMLSRTSREAFRILAWSLSITFIYIKFRFPIVSPSNSFRSCPLASSYFSAPLRYNCHWRRTCGQKFDFTRGRLV